MWSMTVRLLVSRENRSRRLVCDRPGCTAAMVVRGPFTDSALRRVGVLHDSTAHDARPVEFLTRYLDRAQLG